MDRVWFSESVGNSIFFCTFSPHFFFLFAHCTFVLRPDYSKKKMKEKNNKFILQIRLSFFFLTYVNKRTCKCLICCMKVLRDCTAEKILLLSLLHLFRKSERNQLSVILSHLLEIKNHPRRNTKEKKPHSLLAKYYFNLNWNTTGADGGFA